MGPRLGFWLAHLNVLAISAVLLGGFGVQFLWWEHPCPLCLLQRVGMMLCAMGPVYIIATARFGEVSSADFALGYGMSILAAVVGATISGRQVLLHILPGDPGFGDPVMGLHLYTWAFIVFASVLVDAGLNLVFAEFLKPRGMGFGWPSCLTLGLFGLILLANVVAAFFLEGLHWTLPGDPDRYQLLEDLGWVR